MPLTVRKRGRFYYARGTVPMRQADGSITKIRIEEATGEVARARAIRFANDLWDYYRERAYRPTRKSISFTDAALTYVKTKNPSKRDRQILAKLVGYFGETPIEEIGQAKAAEAAHRLYPAGKASSHNRAIFAPIISVLRLSGRRPNIQRPRHVKTVRVIPGEGWFDSLLPHCGNRLAALIIFITLTGRRISEALEAIDNGDGTYTIPRTKLGNSVVGGIPTSVKQLLIGSELGAKLFTYGDRHNVYRELRKACKRAGVSYYGTHAIGRHSFATRLLREGKSLKFVADAGGWASIKMPAQHYAHLEKSEVQAEVKAMGDRWGRELTERQKKAENSE